MTSYIYMISPFLRGLSTNGLVGKAVTFEPDIQVFGYPDIDSIADDNTICFVPWDEERILDTVEAEWQAYTQTWSKQPVKVFVENIGFFILSDDPKDTQNNLFSGAVSSELPMIKKGCGSCGMTTSWYDRRSLLRQRIVVSIGSDLKTLNDVLRFGGASIIEASPGDEELYRYLIPAIGGVDSLMYQITDYDEDEIQENLAKTIEIMSYQTMSDYTCFITFIGDYNSAPRNWEAFIEELNNKYLLNRIRINMIFTKAMSWDAENAAKALMYGWDQAGQGANILKLGV